VSGDHHREVDDQMPADTVTGDRAVDTALADLSASMTGPLDDLTDTAQRLHSTLQQRLADGHGG